MRVLLVGYYGKENFGDDLLLAVTHSLVRRSWPDAKIVVQCDGDKYGYLPSLLSDNSLEVVKPGHGERFDLTVFGGGGVFFDFSPGRFRDRVVNLVIETLGGRTYSKLDSALRTIADKHLFESCVTIGWGLGVGTYTSSSRKMRHHLPILNKFSGLMVRDVGSVRNLRAMGIAAPVRLGSDVAFLGEHWAPSAARNCDYPRDRRRVGIILRGWSSDGQVYLEHFRNALPKIAAVYDVTFFFLDRNTDQEVMHVADGFPVEVWQPDRSSLADFAKLLAAQNGLITARAHGAISGAVVGVPSVLIELEPKLRAIHSMLPGSTALTSPYIDPDAILSKLEFICSISADTVVNDVSRNQFLVRSQVAELIDSAKNSINA